LTLQSITSQTGKALKVTNQARTTTLFSINASGSITFPDGSTQTSAATYDPNLIVNAQTGTTYTLLAGDAQKIVTLNNASDITVTLASNATQALPVGTQISLLQLGIGQVNVVGASSPNPVTIYANPGKKTRAQYSLITLIQLTTDTWLLTGDATA
jgi:butyrate kinase